VFRTIALPGALPSIMAGVIAVLGFVFSLVLDEIERMLIPWKANA
jgi:ABC-type nitrate/sulfonate/bicarbonate transport system permease component